MRHCFSLALAVADFLPFPTHLPTLKYFHCIENRKIHTRFSLSEEFISANTFFSRENFKFMFSIVRELTDYCNDFSNHPLQKC